MWHTGINGGGEKSVYKTMLGNIQMWKPLYKLFYVYTVLTQVYCISIRVPQRNPFLKNVSKLCMHVIKSAYLKYTEEMLFPLGVKW